ncbi:portal protein [Nitrobacteraceae bacterium UC4449_H16]
MSASAAAKGTLQNRWDQLDAKKSGYKTRSEQYAKWTLPFLFPADSGSENNSEQQLSNDSIGARSVNHLSNKVVSTLFRPQGPFFRLSLSAEQLKKIESLSEGADPAEVAELLSKVEKELNGTEREAIEYLDMVAYRPQATLAAQLLVATGNALVYHPKGKPVQVFTLRDYCVVRDLSGIVIEIMTRECKAFETFLPSVQEQLRAGKRTNEYEDTTDVTVYTQIKLNGDGKFYAKQEAGFVALDTDGASWPVDVLPWIPLTWTLVRGEDYGRGLVEDYAGAFHAIEVLTQSLINLAGIMGDIKFLVNPASLIDVVALNNSLAGSYHAGKKDDVSAIQTDKNSDANFIVTMIERFEKQIAQAFLLNSSVTRNAERVTAEEIRIQANELEMSVGGIYSRLALQWQGPTANITLDHINFKGVHDGIKPKIITGMDSLSRQGELDNVRQWIGDLAMLEAVPEDIRSVINPLKFASYLATQRQVEFAKFLFTQAELQANREAQQAELERQEQMKAAGTVAASAGKAAVEGSQTA